MLRELNRRTSGNVTVSLFWDDSFGRAMLTVDEGDKYGEPFQVPAHRAQDAFEHPYAYMAARAA